VGIEDHPSRSPVGKQFAAFGVPLEHPYPRIRSALSDVFTRDFVSHLNKSVAETGGEPVTHGETILIRSMMDDVARSAIEKALNPDPDISGPTRVQIFNHLRNRHHE
jgi:hypothetical protein